MPQPQNRLSLLRSLAEHSSRPAATLTNLITTGATASEDFPEPLIFDRVLVDTSAGAVTITLPPGSKALDGRILSIQKVAGANDAILAATAIDAGTQLVVSDLYGVAEVYWSQTRGRYLRVGSAAGGVSALSLGHGTGSPSLTIDKGGDGTASLTLKSEGVRRAEIMLDSSERLTVATYDGAESLLSQLLFSNTDGSATFSKALTLSVTGAPALVLSGAPEGLATSALLRLGNALSGGSASGTYLGANAANGYTGDLINLQSNGTNRFRVTGTGDVWIGSVNLGSTVSSIRSAISAGILATAHHYDDVRSATAQFRYFAFAVASGYLTDLTVVLNGALATGNLVLVVEVDGIDKSASFTTVTVPQVGSADGTVTWMVANAAIHLTTNSKIKVTIAGANTALVGADIIAKAVY